MREKYRMKIWYLIVFNLFFSFAGSFLALYFGAENLVSYIISIGFSILFIIFLLLVVDELKNFFNNNASSWLTMFIIGIIVGFILWYTMVLFIPLTQLALDNCHINICGVVLDKYYSHKSEGSFLNLDRDLLASMVVLYVLIGPLKEELLYRVAMTTVLYKRYNLLSSTIIVSLIFAVFHLKYFIFMAALSLTLSALVFKYRNIFPAVIAHGTYNAMIYFLYPSDIIIGSYTNLSVLEILLSIVFLLSLYYFSYNNIKRYSLDWLNQK